MLATGLISKRSKLVLSDMFVNGQDATRLASMIKLKAGRLSRQVGDSCLQYWGGEH